MEEFVKVIGDNLADLQEINEQTISQYEKKDYKTGWDCMSKIVQNIFKK